MRAPSSTASSRASSNSSPKSGEVKPRPPSANNRGSGINGQSERTNRNSTLQEDLMRLINPDYIEGSPPTNILPSLKSNVSPVRNLTPERNRFSSPSTLPLLPDTNVANWSTLVDTATKAFIHLDHDTERGSPLPPPFPSVENQKAVADTSQISSSTSSLSPSIESRISGNTAHSISPPSWREQPLQLALNG